MKFDAKVFNLVLGILTTVFACIAFGLALNNWAIGICIGTMFFPVFSMMPSEAATKGKPETTKPAPEPDDLL